MKKNNMCFITLTSLSYRKNFGIVFKEEGNEQTEQLQEEHTPTD